MGPETNVGWLLVFRGVPVVYEFLLIAATQDDV